MRQIHIGYWLAAVLWTGAPATAPAADNDPLEVARKFEDAFVQVAETASPSVVVVTHVLPNGPPARSELEAGDVITEVNQQRVRTADEFEQALSLADARKGVIVTLTRNGMSAFEVLKDSGD